MKTSTLKSLFTTVLRDAMLKQFDLNKNTISSIISSTIYTDTHFSRRITQ